MDIGKVLEELGVSSFRFTAMSLKAYQQHLEKVCEVSHERAELMVNLCYLSTMELAVLDLFAQGCPPPLLFPPPIETLPKHAKIAILKTDTTATFPCETAERLPVYNIEKVHTADWGLFSADVERIGDIGFEVKVPSEVLRRDFIGKLNSLYQHMASLPELDVCAYKITEWEALIWRLKLEICLAIPEKSVRNMIPELASKLGLSRS